MWRSGYSWVFRVRELLLPSHVPVQPGAERFVLVLAEAHVEDGGAVLVLLE